VRVLITLVLAVGPAYIKIIFIVVSVVFEVEFKRLLLSLSLLLSLGAPWLFFTLLVFT
jgi:hypothetical protein